MPNRAGRQRCYIVGGLRTPIGKFGGRLSGVPAPGLGAAVVRELLAVAQCAPDQVDQVVFGNVLQAGVGMNPARQAAVHGGLPFSVPAYTVNMVCASGLYAVVLGDRAIRDGRARVVIAGGFESMSRAPRTLANTRWGKPLGHDTASDTMLTDGLWDAFYDCHMAVTAERLIERYGILRSDQDQYALESHWKAIQARESGLFQSEIIEVRSGGKAISDDEGPREDTSLQKLAALEPVFLPNGTITAGNASSLSDGAAAVVLSARKPTDTQFSAEIVDSALVALDPMDMGLAPVQAIDRLLNQTHVRANDIGLWEINEAFAGQVLAVLREMPLPREQMNVNGGAIALGHPIGCSGTRVLVTLLHEMKRRHVELGVAALCVGGGLGLAVLVRSLL